MKEKKTIYELGRELGVAYNELYHCLFGPILKFLTRLLK